MHEIVITSGLLTTADAKKHISEEVKKSNKVIKVTNGVRQFIFRVVGNRLHHQIQKQGR